MLNELNERSRQLLFVLSLSLGFRSCVGLRVVYINKKGDGMFLCGDALFCSVLF